MKSQAKPGRGQRACPACGGTCGVRSRVCNGCGHAFTGHDGESPSHPATPPEPKVITTYDGPGQGRKQCKACGAYVGVRNHTCICGNAFVATPSHSPDRGSAAKKEAAQEKREQDAPDPSNIGKRGYDEHGNWLHPGYPDPGKTYTPNLAVDPSLIVGVKKEDLDSFNKSNNAAMAEVVKNASPGFRLSVPMSSHDLPCPESGRRWQGSGPSTAGFHRIAVPAGECPVKLAGLTREAVAVWIDGIQAVFAKRREECTPYAIEYWLRDFHDLGTPEHTRGVALIEEIMGSSVETY